VRVFPMSHSKSLPNCCRFGTRCWRVSLSLLLLLSICSTISVAQEAVQPLVPIAQSAGGGMMNGQATSVGGLSDGPIAPGDVVDVKVFNAPNLSTLTRVSMTGDIAVPLLGVFHIGGLTSLEASARVASLLKEHNYVLHPSVIVIDDSTETGITVLGEVHSPGIFAPPGKHLLSDLLAAAGGMTANTGRVIEISNFKSPEDITYIPWDPTMHNTSSYDVAVHAGDRIIVRACGIAYIGGNVAKPGAYSLCGSREETLSQFIALAGGVMPSSSTSHTIIVRRNPDGTKIAIDVDVHKILLSKAPDIVIREDDVVYVPPSGIKYFVKSALEFSASLAAPLIYVYHP